MFETMGYRDTVEPFRAPFCIVATCSRSWAFSCRNLAISSLSELGLFPFGIHAEAAEETDGVENWDAAAGLSGRVGVGNRIHQVSYDL